LGEHRATGQPKPVDGVPNKLERGSIATMSKNG
jgi:hypothetical protein